MAEHAPESALPRGDDFPTLLRAYRQRANRSGTALAAEVGVTPSYLSRLEGGTREAPRADVVENICTALRLSLPDQNRLLLAAGFAPTSLAALGQWDPAVQATLDVLNDQRLSPEERAAFRTALLLMAENWGDRSRRGAALRVVDQTDTPTSATHAEDEPTPLPTPR